MLVFHNFLKVSQGPLASNVVYLVGFFHLLSIMQAAVDVAFPYCHMRKAFERPIGHFQVAFALAYLCMLISFCFCSVTLRNGYDRHGLTFFNEVHPIFVELLL